MKKGERERKYAISIGDLSINQVIELQELCGSSASVGLSSRVINACEVTWAIHNALSRIDKIWQQHVEIFFERKEANKQAKRKAKGE